MRACWIISAIVAVFATFAAGAGEFHFIFLHRSPPDGSLIFGCGGVMNLSFLPLLN
jgi:hypothetical protein